MKGLKFLVTLFVATNLLSTPILAQSSEMAGRDDFQAQQRALIIRIEQQESRLAALEKEIGALRAQLSGHSPAAPAPSPKAIDLRPSSAPEPSTPAPVAAPVASIGMQDYTVRSGDSLVAIARLHGVSVADLMSLNNLRSDRIQIGDKLMIPLRGQPVATQSSTLVKDEPAIAVAEPAPETAPPARGDTYTIASGDTIVRIARRHGVSIEEIVAANGLQNPNQLSVGQKIVSPTQSPAARPANSVAAASKVTPSPPINRAETSMPREAAPEASAVPEPTPDNPFPTGYAYYTIVAGDSLYSIADLFGTTQKELEALNKIEAGGVIHPGKQIIVPVANYKGPFVSN